MPRKKIISAPVPITKDPVYRPLPAQIAFHKSKARFRIIIAGRRSGKTRSVLEEFVRKAATTPNQLYWWVSLTNETACKGFDLFNRIYSASGEMRRNHVAQVRKKPACILFKNGSEIHFKSCDNPEGLLGSGLDGLAVDEAPFIPDDVWYRTLRAMLTDTGGFGVIIGTPDRKNFVYDLYLKGINPDIKNYESFHWTSADNIYIKDLEEEIAQAREDLPKEVFENLYEAKWMSDESAVFMGLSDAISSEPVIKDGNKWWIKGEEKGDDKSIYSMGVDVAKGGRDYTVFTIAKAKRGEGGRWYKKIVYAERLQEESFKVQAHKIAELHRKYSKAHIFLDATVIGSVLLDELRGPEHRIAPHLLTPMIFTGKNKVDFVTKLRADIEHGRLTMLYIKELVEEFRLYEAHYNVTSGAVKFGAPGSKHDDFVVSVGLANMKSLMFSTGPRAFGAEVKRALGF